jgi:putative heme-binding domain-containing protein
MLMPRHDSLGLREDLICTEFNTRRVSRHRLTRSGSSYAAETSTFLESDQSDFHPTDVIEDAGGSLLVADTGSWYMICCPTSKIAKPDVLGAIYRIQKKGSKPPADPRGLKLDWDQPQVRWLSDERPVVAKRAIDALARVNNIDALRTASPGIPVVWTLHRIPGQRARNAVRGLLSAEDSYVRAAAIHSVALWRDRDALKPLIELLSDDDPQLRRLAAMALGRIGESHAVKPLLDSWSNKIDPFLRHAIIYALYEIGDVRSLPTGHPLGKQVRHMREIDQQKAAPGIFPEIQLAEVKKPNPDKIASQKQRLDMLAAFLPKGDAQRGARLFNNRDRSKCIICHLNGKKGVRLGPDLTSIGAIRSERDLLEAIVFPSASIARYHEVVNVLTRDGSVVSGLLVRETVDEMFLSSAEGVVQSVAYREIEQARYSSVSLMPEGLDQLLKPEEIANLVAYLKESKPPEGTLRVDQATSSKQ